MTLQNLLKIPESQRDQNWENQFFVELTDSKVNLLQETPQVGPDSWPYLLTSTSEDGSDGQESVQKILHWLSLKGIGLVVNPQKEYPDYVFNYGMIWFFRETGLFYKKIEEPLLVGSFEIAEGETLCSGAPSEAYLPVYVRKIIKAFFLDQGILNPRILMVSKDQINYDLAFSLESLSNPPEKEHMGIAEAIGWFLPPHYSVVLLSEKGLPKFFEL